MRYGQPGYGPRISGTGEPSMTNRPRVWIVAIAAALILAACGSGGDEPATGRSTTTAGGATTTDTTIEVTATTAPAEPLDPTATQYLGLFNAQIPLLGLDGAGLQLDPVTDGVYGSTVDLGTTVLVFAESPTSKVTAVAVVVDLDITGGQTPTRLITGASLGLDDAAGDVVAAFDDQVLPSLGNITERRSEFNLGTLDLILTVTGDSVLTFTYVAPGGEIPAYLET